jgi:hypothetical protein
MLQRPTRRSSRFSAGVRLRRRARGLNGGSLLFAISFSLRGLLSSFARIALRHPVDGHGLAAELAIVELV